MKNKNLLKTVATSAFACVCTAAMVTGILAATSHTVNISTSVSFSAQGVSGTIKGTLNGQVWDSTNSVYADNSTTSTTESSSAFVYGADINQYFGVQNNVVGSYTTAVTPATINNSITDLTWNIAGTGGLHFTDNDGMASKIFIDFEITNTGTNPMFIELSDENLLDSTDDNLSVQYYVAYGSDAYSTGTAFEGSATAGIETSQSVKIRLALSVEEPTNPVSSTALTLSLNMEKGAVVSYNANTGTGTQTSQVVEIGEAFTLPTTTTFTAPTNKVFAGWSLTSDGEIITETTVSAGTTLYAIWGDAVVVTGIADSTAGSAAVLVGEKSLLSLVAPQKANHIIEGYYIDSSYTTKVADIDGNLLASVSDYTDNTGAWTRTTSTTLYAKMLEPGLYLNGTYSTANNNFVSWATLASSNGGYWANSNNSPIVDNGNGTYSIVGNDDDEDYESYFVTDGLVGSLVIPSSVTSIGDGAFDGCTGLTNITIPSSVTSIGDCAFDSCSGLTSITIPSSVTSIGLNAFYGCIGLTDVTIPSSVTSIGVWAFYGCTGLTNITIPSSVTSIGYDAFSDTAFITNIASTTATASTGVNTAFVENNVYYLTCSDDATKYICFGAIGSTKPTGDLTIKSGTVCLVDSAFEGCTGLTNITIPSSVTSIGNYAFYCCTGLTNITIPSSVTSIRVWAFSGCTGLTNITIPSSVTSIGGSAFEDCSSLTNITIPSSVTSIGSQAFDSCTGLTNITIPSSVTSIGNYAFSSCTGLTNITIPSSVTSIGVGAFDGCTGLTNITIPSGVTSIGYAAFSCTGLTNITIPSSVTSIGGSAFSNTAFITNLASTTATASTGVNTAFVENNVYYLTCSDDATKYICFGAIGSTKPTGDLTIKSGTVCLVDSAFEGCTGLTNITIPSGVTSIGSYMFSGCTGLTNITIPSSVTSIGSQAFDSCTGLTNITIPSSVTSIGNYAFSSCTGLTNITIPSSVTSIGGSAFEGCTGLTNITIPSGVTSIGKYAFDGCTGLTTINYTGTQAQWNAISGHGNAESASNPTRTINYNYVAP